MQVNTHKSVFMTYRSDQTVLGGFSQSAYFIIDLEFSVDIIDVRLHLRQQAKQAILYTFLRLRVRNKKAA